MPFKAEINLAWYFIMLKFSACIWELFSCSNSLSESVLEKFQISINGLADLYPHRSLKIFLRDLIAERKVTLDSWRMLLTHSQVVFLPYVLKIPIPLLDVGVNSNHSQLFYVLNCCHGDIFKKCTSYWHLNHLLDTLKSSKVLTDVA